MSGERQVANVNLKRFGEDQGYSRDRLVKEDGVNLFVRLPNGETRRVFGVTMGTEAGTTRNIGVVFEAREGDVGYADYLD